MDGQVNACPRVSDKFDSFETCETLTRTNQGIAISRRVWLGQVC